MGCEAFRSILLDLISKQILAPIDMNNVANKTVEFIGCFTVARQGLIQITPVKLISPVGATMSTKDEIYLHAEKIDKIYPGTKALDQVSFDIKRGKVNVLIGENGAGKSTLMRIIAGIEKQSAGKLFCRDERLSSIQQLMQEKKVLPLSIRSCASFQI